MAFFRQTEWLYLLSLLLLQIAGAINSVLGCGTVPIKYSIRAHTKAEEDFRIMLLLFTFNFSVDALKSIPDSRYSQGLVGFLCCFNSDRDTCRSVALRELVNSSEGRKEWSIIHQTPSTTRNMTTTCLSPFLSCAHTRSVYTICAITLFSFKQSLEKLVSLSMLEHSSLGCCIKCSWHHCSVPPASLSLIILILGINKTTERSGWFTEKEQNS